MESSEMISAPIRCASAMPTAVLPTAVAPVRNQQSWKVGFISGGTVRGNSVLLSLRERSIRLAERNDDTNSLSQYRRGQARPHPPSLTSARSTACEGQRRL